MSEHHSPQRFLLGQLTLDCFSRELSSATETLTLEPQVFQLLSLFIDAEQHQRLRAGGHAAPVEVGIAIAAEAQVLRRVRHAEGELFRDARQVAEARGHQLHG